MEYYMWITRCWRWLQIMLLFSLLCRCKIVANSFDTIDKSIGSMSLFVTTPTSLEVWAEMQGWGRSPWRLLTLMIFDAFLSILSRIYHPSSPSPMKRDFYSHRRLQSSSSPFWIVQSIFFFATPFTRFTPARYASYTINASNVSHWCDKIFIGQYVE